MNREINWNLITKSTWEQKCFSIDSENGKVYYSLHPIEGKELLKFTYKRKLKNSRKCSWHDIYVESFENLLLVLYHFKEQSKGNYIYIVQ